ncbi:MAG: hypothetical protein ABI679_11145 [Gemmatimonadota bacterium]
MTIFGRSRFAAFLLLLASPGVSGLAIDAAHPCPAKAPWMAHSAGQHAGHATSPDFRTGSGQEDLSHQATHNNHDCRCVGACHTALAVRTPAADALYTVLPPTVGLALRPRDTFFIPNRRPGDRLPPATAPPLA